MRIFALSVNHQVAPVAVREQVAFPAERLADTLRDLCARKNIGGCLILSTCNRTEIYATGRVDIRAELRKWLAQKHQISLEKIAPYVDDFADLEATRHLSKVATGVDSMVFGEAQILGQIKDSYHAAKDAKTLDKVLEKLLQHVFSTAKKVRTNTKIGVSPVSVASCAVQLSEKIFSNLSAQNILLIGAGEMITLCARHFRQKKINRIAIANRTLENAEILARPFNAEAIALSEISDQLSNFDIIVSSTAAPVPILGKGLVETALKKRRYKPIFMLDIAVPRDIEPEVGQLNDVFLYTIDDLRQLADDNIENRAGEKSAALEIIRTENAHFQKWLARLEHETVVRKYHQNAGEIKKNLLENALRKIQNGNEAAQVMEELADQLTQKLLHNPSENIKIASTEKLEHCHGCIPHLKPKNQ